jgi:flagellar motor switch protein FliM
MTVIKTEAASLVRKPQPRAIFAGLRGIAEDIRGGIQSLVAEIAGQAPNVAVHQDESERQSFAAWRKRQPASTALCRVRMDPLDGEMLIALPPRLITQWVEIYYGGTGVNVTDRESFTLAELKLLDRLGPRLAKIIGEAWAKHLDLLPEFRGLGDEIFERTALEEKDEMVIQSYALSGTIFGDAVIDLIYPDVLLQSAARATADVRNSMRRPNSAWQSRLKEAVMQAHVPLRTIFVRTELPLTRLLNLAVGDRIPICLPSRIPVTVGGINFAEATLGETNGRASIRIETLTERTPVHG